MNPNVAIESLARDVRFPSHGRGTDNEGRTYLLFPIFRAAWERAPLGEPMPSDKSPLRIRDMQRMGFFRGHFWKVMTTLGQISRDEQTLRHDPGDGSSPDEYGPYMHAQETLPLWIDLFYVYFRMLANRFCVALGYLASSQPGSWPQNYRELVNADERQLVRWKASEPEALYNALQQHRHWFDLLTTDGHRGVRDSIVHVLAQPVVVKVTDDTGAVSTVVWRETSAGYEERDLLALISDVVADFCRCLSALPPTLWRTERFLVTDLLVSDGPWTTVERFFPAVPSRAKAVGQS